ncbi:hypothetical protein [Shouchella clausii]|uniref:hypothetical protein n=1 Tax=Shouchella clausii TaxID=79880 RepID=UPI0002E46715|nr:hypothetical protein [Shouchella clausii]
MAKVTVRVLNAIVDGKRHGEQLDIEEKSAAYLSSIGYVEVIKDAETKQRNTKGHASKKKSQEKGQKKEVGE